MATAEDALRRLPSLRPDVVSMDIRLPGMNGFEATKQIMSRRPTPIVVVAASVQSDDLNISMNALKAGALSVVEKPPGARHQDYAQLASRLCTQLAIMSQVKVVRQRFNRHPANSSDGLLSGPVFDSHSEHRTSSTNIAMVGIVSSTGGPRALQQLCAALPSDFPVPIVVVQHITPSFQAGFVSWLNDLSPLPVRTAQHHETAQPGTVYIAPAGYHLHVDGARFRLSRETSPAAELPSGTVLLSSMADSLGSQAMGVVLTGMGDDGAKGLLHIREAGGITLAEDESTTVVFGMPAAAIRLDAVTEALPLWAIPTRIVEAVCRTEEVTR